MGGFGRKAAAARRHTGGAKPFDKRVQARGHIATVTDELVDLAAVGHEVTLLAGVGEERRRGFRVDKDQVFDLAKLSGG